MISFMSYIISAPEPKVRPSVRRRRRRCPSSSSTFSNDISSEAMKPYFTYSIYRQGPLTYNGEKMKIAVSLQIF